jgi:hypothetical protein
LFFNVEISFLGRSYSARYAQFPVTATHNLLTATQNKLRQYANPYWVRYKITRHILSSSIAHKTSLFQFNHIGIDEIRRSCAFYPLRNQFLLSAFDLLCRFVYRYKKNLVWYF